MKGSNCNSISAFVEDTVGTEPTTTDTTTTKTDTEYQYVEPEKIHTYQTIIDGKPAEFINEQPIDEDSEAFQEGLESVSKFVMWIAMFDCFELTN